MVGEKSITVNLEGNILAAFQLYCTKNGCKTAGEGVRMIIRNLPEYRQLSLNDSGNPITTQERSQGKSDG